MPTASVARCRGSLTIHQHSRRIDNLASPSPNASSTDRNERTVTDDTAAQHFGRTDNQPPKNKGGRPSTYSPEIAQRICEHIATGGYATNLKRFGLPHESTICDWQNKIPEFAEAYARARERRAETFADQIIEIADTCEDPAKGRLQIDARKFIASKLLPRVYGDNQRVEVQHTLSETAARVLQDLSERAKQRQAIERQVIDVTPVPSLSQGVVEPAISTGCEDTALVPHAAPRRRAGRGEPPAPAEEARPAIGKGHPRSARTPRKNK